MEVIDENKIVKGSIYEHIFMVYETYCFQEEKGEKEQTQGQ